MKNSVLAYIFLQLLFSIFFTGESCAQNKSVVSMRNKANELRKEIKEKEAILLSSEKDINSRLNNLQIITARIEEYKKLVNVLQQEVLVIDKSIRTIDNEIAELDSMVMLKEDTVALSREEYAEALRNARRYGDSQNKLLFIFSADDFNTMARRYRYMNTHMEVHKELAEELKEKIKVLDSMRAELNVKRAELQKMQRAKKASLQEQKKEQDRIERLEEEQRNMISELNREKDKVTAELKKKRKELDELNAVIKREVEKALAAERERQRLAAEKAAKEAAEKEASTNKSTSKTASTSSKKNNKKTAVKGEVSYSKDAGVVKMSGKFEKNKSKLPVPITGSYLLVDKFGQKKALEGKGNVMINNQGLTFKGTKGAQARAVFEGVVSTVFYHNDYICVLVRHENYISVYCNLENVRVKSGDAVKAGDIIADVTPDAEDGNPILLFQLYKEKTLLDPTDWLKL